MSPFQRWSGRIVPEDFDLMMEGEILGYHRFM
jgi:hypothetical protein